MKTRKPLLRSTHPGGRPKEHGTPGKIRTARSRANRTMDGGQRLEVFLSPIGAACLDTIRHSTVPPMTKTEAVHQALAREERRVLRGKD